MSSAPQPSLPVTFPLTDTQQAAYQGLYTTLQSSIDSTSAGPTLDLLIDSRDDVNDILTRDEQARFETGTTFFAAADEELKDSNAGLAALKDHINSVAGHINMAGEIVEAIDKVLTIAPKL